MRVPREPSARPTPPAPMVAPRSDAETRRIKTRRALSALDRGVRSARERVARLASDPTAWDDATPSELVGLYAMLHSHVLGVFPDELRQRQAFLAACSAAKRRCGELGGATPVAGMIRWVFAGIVRRMTRGDAEARVTAWRPTWRWVFASASSLTDYRVAMASRRAG